jgi:hypothetical protein
VNLNHGGWVCFGCGAKGDMVGYVMLRDACDFKAAAQTLGCWDESPSPETVRNMAEQARERQRKREAEEVRQAEERRQRLALRDGVHTAHQVWQRACARLTELKRGAMPTSLDEEEACWSAMSLALKDLRETESQYCAKAGIEE